LVVGAELNLNPEAIEWPVIFGLAVVLINEMKAPVAIRLRVF
jgi:hypothetical protein